MSSRNSTGPIALEVSSLLVPTPSGIGVYGKELIAKLCRSKGVGDLHLVYRFNRRRDMLRHAPGVLPSTAYLRGDLLHHRYPLLHALDTRVPAGYRGKLVATLFDVLSALPISAKLGLSPSHFRSKKLHQYSMIARKSAAIISISRETRRRFQEIFDYAGPHAVVPPGVSPVFRPGAESRERLHRLGLADEEYLLFVGELCRRKNLEAVVGAFLRVSALHRHLRLVLVGRPSFGWRGSPAQRTVAAHRDRIRMLGFLPLEDLAAVYASARVFLFLSHYEGFGLPVLEAMASGVPVLAADRGGIPEAAGDAGCLVDPDDAAAVEAELVRLLEPGGEWERRRRAGLARSSEFSWERAAAGVETVYHELLDCR